MLDDELTITDSLTACISAKAMLHLAPNVKIIHSDAKSICTTLGVICIDGSDEVKIIEAEISEKYNTLIPCLKIEISFTGELSIQIKSKSI